VDAIDLYQIHWPIPDDEVEEGWSTLAELKEEGLVRHIGASNFSVGQLERAESISPVEGLQPPYSLLDREVEAEILPYCEEHGIGVIVYSPMSSGLLTGRMTRERIASLPDDDWRRQSARFREPALSRALRARRASQGGRRAARRLARSGRRRVDAAPPGRPRRDRRVPPPRPGRPDRGAADLELSDDDVAEILGDA
jgi:aryl-alcohol dehydrogenase-like predicted oxidoreductase